jgi:hypothetical protein
MFVNVEGSRSVCSVNANSLLLALEVALLEIVK